MAVIWGFNLSEMSWSAFGHKKMFDRRWHLRKERFIVYQLAMLIGLAAECTATYSLSKYDSLHENIHNFSTSVSTTPASLHNHDIIAAAITTIVFCVLVATIFGADFFFLLFWPTRTYPRWYTFAKKALAVVITAGVGVAAIVSTIVITSHQAFISGVDEGSKAHLVEVYFRPPLVYSHWAQNIAWLVLLWITFVCTAASTIIMFIAAAYDAEFGPMPKTVSENNTETSEGTPIVMREGAGRPI
ncbi:hypothetical protein GALMADRAFT_243725 [Galerina marginata CBS 339.88]|uniref:Uncharacterized protein n=1 Tax=Galerina marginata (strain CBS 339.88) TaxID=685588 RepID=A0A067TKZ3_GALM3|nr:hypothetical protein GALMADRAFT_243725 [Galerina marginata CBS 339.88]